MKHLALEDDYSGVRNKILFTKYKNKKNNEIVGAMYAAYKSGMSLETIGKMYRRSRQTIYDVFRSRGYKLRSKEMKGLQILDGIKFCLTKNYMRGTLNKKRISMARYVYEKENKITLNKNFAIYHKDGNIENNTKENLAIINKKDMAKIFNPEHHNQFTSLSINKK